MPCYYFQKPDVLSSYIGIGNEPRFSFGHGLSYTQFEYGKISLSKNPATAEDKITVSLSIPNTGKVMGDEVVQLYLKDQYASVATPKIKLKGFQRITLMPGESKQVSFIITK